MNSSRELTKFDYVLAFLLFLLFCASCIALYSAQTTSSQYGENFLLKQIIWYVVGICIIGGIMVFEPDQIRKLSWYLYGFSIMILIILFISPASIAPKVNGAKSWFILPGFGSFQPSEITKVCLIIMLSHIISKHNEKNVYRTIQTDFLLLGKITFVAILPMGLVMLQPDLGTTLVMMVITVGLIFMSGITWKILLPIFTTIIAAASTIFYLVLQAPELLEKYLNVRKYQFGRIYSWLDPYTYSSGDGYHLLNSLKAIGSGMLTGKGIGENEVYIPENHTDFIFAVVAEQYGFIGATVVICLLFLLLYHITKVGLLSNSDFASYICVGVICMIGFHVIQNIGMTIGLLPITGIPLPFISYGGSSLVGNMFALGLIFSIRFYYRTYMFSEE
ncbi:FtsW/RodA/SpoVE family cell cycle protein [Bacillus pinisoli]|uniref:FtsW/RodA/SpoVE family cell cycle protein n=1 Tax=Bacillus pinisoli TaxID=2901866 RepID=UPI001FF1CF53|nr:FtsW/RodA/SpoVE family cell cycle protein [Bacillus pinisoli]